MDSSLPPEPSQVAILTEKSRDEIADAVEEAVSGSNGRLRAVLREGSPADPGSLKLVAAHAARRVIVLHQEEGDVGMPQEAAKAAAVLGLSPAAGARPRVVVQMVGSPEEDVAALAARQRAAALAGGAAGGSAGGSAEFRFMDGHASLARLLGQCAYQPDLARVYRELLQQARWRLGDAAARSLPRFRPALTQYLPASAARALTAVGGGERAVRRAAPRRARGAHLRRRVAVVRLHSDRVHPGHPGCYPGGEGALRPHLPPGLGRAARRRQDRGHRARHQGGVAAPGVERGGAPWGISAMLPRERAPPRRMGLRLNLRRAATRGAGVVCLRQARGAGKARPPEAGRRRCGDGSLLSPTTAATALTLSPPPRRPPPATAARQGTPRST